MQSLSHKDLEQLRDGQARLQAGDGDGALMQLSKVAANTQHPEALHLFAFALMHNARTEEAQHVMESCLELAPHHAPYWNSYGSLLDVMGFPDQAAAAFEKAGRLTTGYLEPWINLARIALRFGDPIRAENAIQHALSIDPDNLDVLHIAGTIARECKNPDLAVRYFKTAILANGSDWRTRHNLASALRELDNNEDALTEVEKAIKTGANIPETLTLRGHLLADLGRFSEAIEQYQDVCTIHPGHAEAHEMLAKLLPQLDTGIGALESYRRALAAEPQNSALLESAMRSAHDLKDHAQLADWAQLGLRNFGDQPEYWLSLAAAHQHAGDHRSAHALLSGRYENMAVGHLFLSHSLLCLQDPKAAEAHALATTQLAPLDQSGWAHLSLIWRLLNDPREFWLADYERFVLPVDIALPKNLAEILSLMHTTHHHPAEQTLRGGTQTRGNLFDRRVPEVQTLMAEVRRVLTAQIACLPDDSAHPFLSRKADRFDFSASWSVRLSSEGFHINHIHPKGWISSALYIDLPPALQNGAGNLTFGVPDAAYGYELSPRREETPEIGKLIFFPSYFWHGTKPFQNEHHRLTVAFDAIPVGDL
jgi:tetratricopeptide (TPR) repeat protein